MVHAHYEFKSAVIWIDSINIDVLLYARLFDLVANEWSYGRNYDI